MNHRELKIKDIIEILGSTIKRDDLNKVTTFLTMLLAYTEDSQMNIGFQAPSSTGKSFIATEIARYFPKQDVIELAGCTPNALLYDASNYNKEEDYYLVDLERKIIIFVEQPGTELLGKIRPLLSHDSKELRFESTDPNKMRKRTSILRGFCSLVFCTAGLKIDEQESTRFLLLSPDTDQEKLREAIIASMRKESDGEKFISKINSNPLRAELKDRIQAIRDTRINNIIIPNEEVIIERYLKSIPVIKPRHQRDNKKLLGLIKSLALLNCFNRERTGNDIVAQQSDIDTGFEIWDKISESQELSLSPYLCDFLKNIIIPTYNEALEEAKENDSSFGFDVVVGATRSDIAKKAYQVTGKFLDDNYFRRQILPMLVTAGVVREEASVADRRNKLVIPNLDEYQKPEKTKEEETELFSKIQSEDDFIPF